ncbi:hypothetical protein U8D42_13250 [Mycobacterium europaeum]|uniref:Uncharacterized protein n=1 Tax=Mycobacterium europaeum TaxID=761804 RepID=A0A0U1DRQ7_9MYCO|nr:hypothetical protein [Mycobacterium europaeum]MEA1160568.1 hypothetical protein [Mycobacterium europaeum]ORV61399.1 hypothetical protein AWC03_09330 [Mycobacterium europaeum]CQD21642.1 hypothetical protein BN000_05312 [Mycobacterium europaeum]
MRTIAAGGLLLALVFGSGIAHADSGDEQQACQLMDDPAAAQQGFEPVEYAFMQLRSRMSAERARTIMSEAVQDYCPNHWADLPASWR